MVEDVVQVLPPRAEMRLSEWSVSDKDAGGKGGYGEQELTRHGTQASSCHRPPAFPARAGRALAQWAGTRRGKVSLAGEESARNVVAESVDSVVFV